MNELYYLWELIEGESVQARHGPYKTMAEAEWSISMWVNDDYHPSYTAANIHLFEMRKTEVPFNVS